jgi:hypothetical protein
VDLIFLPFVFDCIKAKDSDNCPITDIINKTPRKAPSLIEKMKLL